MSDDVLAANGTVTSHLEIYCKANMLFHETIMADCGNDLIDHTFKQIAMSPLTVCQSKHVTIFDALEKRDVGPVEAMMHDHNPAARNY